jgi:hypothetical protein
VVLDGADRGLESSSEGLGLVGLSRQRQNGLQELVRSKGASELRGAAHDTSRTALEERLEAFLLIDGGRTVEEATVMGLSLASFHLKTRLDDVKRRREVRGGHTGDGSRAQKLEDAQALGLGFAEDVLLEMSIGREVNCREWNVSKETRAGSFVKADQSQVFNYPDGGPPGHSLNVLGDLSLNLKTDLDDFQGAKRNVSGEPIGNRKRYSLCKDDLASSGHTTSKHFPTNRDVTVLIGSLATDEVVHGKFDSFLWSNTLETKLADFSLPNTI